MKTDRLIGIITVLLRETRVTMPYLAEKFEVSIRTINRDIESICMAGIPIVTERGRGGGVYITDGYKIDNVLLSDSDLKTLFVGLRGLDSVMEQPKSTEIAKKLSVKNDSIFTDCISIDLSSFGQKALKEKINTLKDAIGRHRVIEFEYFYIKGNMKRTIEPCLIAFKWSSWYIYGYCRLRNDFRMFKLSRLWELRVTDEEFIPREMPKEESERERPLENIEWFHFTAELEQSECYRIVDSVGPNCFKMLDNGKIWFEDWSSNVYSATETVLKFGSKIKVLTPPELIEEVKKETQKVLDFYNI